MVFRIVLGCLCLLALSTTVGAKTGQTLHTAKEVVTARSNAARYDWAKAQVESLRLAVAWIMEMPDSSLWSYIPPADLPRALNVRFGVGCPVHGKEVFAKGGHYPWIMDRNQPFKVQCPVGGEIYPTNDFAAWYKGGRQEKLDTHQKYVDDGYGYIDEEGNRYWFVGHYVFWQLWRRDILPGVDRLGSLYLMTGDRRYAHKAAVMLARIASEYPAMDYRTQAYHNGQWPSGYNGKILDLDWEGSNVVSLSTVYDDIYDMLDTDAELGAFLKRKGIADIKEFIEKNLLQEMAQCIMEGVIHGNMNYQQQLAHLAIVLDNDDRARGFTTRQMVDWILKGGGEMETLLYNGVDRDGAGSESSPGYNTIWASSFLDLAEKLKPLGYDMLGQLRLKKMIDCFIDITAAGKFVPSIGDIGGNLRGEPPVWPSNLFMEGYRLYRDPRYAKSLNRIGWPKPSLFEPQEISQKELVKRKSYGSDLEWKSRNMGGYGLGILETGEGDHRRALTMYYGSSGAWHGHWDRLNIEMFAYGRSMLPEMGYPAHWGDKAYFWTQNTPSHYLVLVDGQNHRNKRAGSLGFFAVAPGVQAMDASAEAVYPGQVSQYRRTVAMVDISPEDSYLLDVFRVSGGQQHDYSFHGLPFADLSVEGVSLSEPGKGTVAGEDVPFGVRPPGDRGGGFQYLFNPRRGHPAGMWSASWDVPGEGMGLKMTMLPGAAQEVIAADAEAEIRPDLPKTLKYVLARNRGQDLGSVYAAVIEPYRKSPRIRRVERIPLTSQDSDAVAVRVSAGDGEDTLISSPEAAMLSSDDQKIRFKGELGALRKDSHGLKSLFLFNGSLLEADGWRIEGSGRTEATVASVDYIRNRLTLDKTFPRPGALVGQVIILENRHYRTSYTVRGARANHGKTIIDLDDASPLDGLIRITEMREEDRSLKTDTRLSGYGIKFDGKSFLGMGLVNEARDRVLPFSGYNNSVFCAGGAESLKAVFQDRNRDGHIMVYLADITPGDRAIIPSSLSLTREADRAYTVQATSPFKLSIPQSAGKRILLLQLNGEWMPVPVRRDGESLTADLGRSGAEKERVRME